MSNKMNNLINKRATNTPKTEPETPGSGVDAVVPVTQAELAQVDSGAQMYFMPSKPASFVFSDGTRRVCPDGVIQGNNDSECRQLQAACDAGAIFVYDPTEFGESNFRKDFQAVSSDKVN